MKADHKSLMLLNLILMTKTFSSYKK